MKKLAIIGATGLVGTELVRILESKPCTITVVGRSLDKLVQRFPHVSAHMTWADFAKSDAQAYDTIINLAGSGVSEQKWTERYKQTMIDSRLDSTRLSVDMCRQNSRIHLINASAVSAYGFYTDANVRFTEQDRDKRSGTAFLQDLIDRWETAAVAAQSFGNPVTLLRTGVVLDLAEGALPALLKPFQMFIGGPIGTGQQMMSWISTADFARIIAFLIERPDITGPVNCTSPGACSNRDFARAVGRALGRPSAITTPAFIIRAAMGQMGDELVVKGQHVYPAKLLDAGFTFEHPTLAAFFDAVFSR
jgi:hypothetical protein